MATDIVEQLADSLAKTGVEDGELSYKGQGRKLDDAQSGECQVSLCQETCQKNTQKPQFLWLSQLIIWITVTLHSPICFSQPVTRYLFHLSPVEEIVKEIRDFEGLQALRLEGNTVGVEAAQAIAKALETKSEFKV